MSEEFFDTTKNGTQSTAPLLSNQIEDPVQSGDRTSQVQIIIIQVVRRVDIHLGNCQQLQVRPHLTQGLGPMRWTQGKY